MVKRKKIAVYPVSPGFRTARDVAEAVSAGVVRPGAPPFPAALDDLRGRRVGPFTVLAYACAGVVSPWWQVRCRDCGGLAYLRGCKIRSGRATRHRGCGRPADPMHTVVAVRVRLDAWGRIERAAAAAGLRAQDHAARLLEEIGARL